MGTGLQSVPPAGGAGEVVLIRVQVHFLVRKSAIFALATRSVVEGMEKTALEGNSLDLGMWLATN